METDPVIWERLRTVEQRLAAIELNLQRVMIDAQVAWVHPDPVGADTQFAQALEALRAGNKIGAIKLVREQTGMDLAEAKRAVEDLERQL